MDTFNCFRLLSSQLTKNVCFTSYSTNFAKCSFRILTFYASRFSKLKLVEANRLRGKCTKLHSESPNSNWSACTRGQTTVVMVRTGPQWRYNNRRWNTTVTWRALLSTSAHYITFINSVILLSPLKIFLL